MEGAKVQLGDSEPRISTLPTSLSDAYRKKLGENIDLSKRQEKRIKKFLKNSIREYIEDTGPLHRMLEEWNDLAEGVPKESNIPLDWAPADHVPICETYLDVYRSVEQRSILNASTIWYTEFEPGFEQLADYVAGIDEMVNWKARNEWNIEDAIRGVLPPTNRDGLAWIQVVWAEDYKKRADILLITNEDELLKEFPSPEEAGISPEEWKKLQSQAQKASEEAPLEIPITFEKRTYYGNKGEIVELIDFVCIPASVPSIKHPLCRGYGKRFWERKGNIKQKVRDEVYYDKAAKELLKKEKGTQPSSYIRSQDEHEGLGRSGAKEQFEEYELVVRGSLEENDDGTWNEEEQEYFVVYNYEHDILLRCTEYPYRVEHYAPFRIDSRANRLIGKGIPQKVMQMNDSIDKLHNNRIMSHQIANIPSFKGKKGAKRDFDAYAEENMWSPGCIFWLDDPEAFMQFPVQPTDQGASLLDEQHAVKLMDQYLGSATSVLSGGVAPGDPSAPGNKTAMMIQQSNLRMDFPIDELREGVEEVGAICLSHLYQFGPPQLEYLKDELIEGKAVRKTETIHKKYLRKGLKLKMSGVTVLQNPEAELMKGFQMREFLLQEPLFANSAERRTKQLQDTLRNGRVPGRKEYVPTIEEAHQAQVQLEMEAQEAREVEEEKQRQAEIDANLANAKKDLEIKNTAQKVAESNLGYGGEHAGTA